MIDLTPEEYRALAHFTPWKRAQMPAWSQCVRRSVAKSRPHRRYEDSPSIHVEAKLDRSDAFRQRNGDEARTRPSIHTSTLHFDRGSQRRPVRVDAPCTASGDSRALCRVKKSWTDQLLRRSVR